MKHKLTSLAKTFHPARLSSLAAYLLKDEAISGKLIIGAVILALIAANSPLAETYTSLWQTKLGIGLGDWSLSLNLHHWVSDFLMAFFFLVVGLELKRELVHGKLRKFKTAVLPFGAAIGGMLVPALIYVAFTYGTDGIDGWAIPTATDIALAIGLLALLGSRVPSSVRLFLLTLAIVDDILAVIIITLFYSTNLNVEMLLFAVLLVMVMLWLQTRRLMTMPLFVVGGVALWLFVYASGVHASITGAALGLLAPTALLAGGKKSIAERLEKLVIPFSALVVVPLFAFASTGTKLGLGSLQQGSAMHIAVGIILGLVVGKAVGIVGASWLMVRLGWANLPARSNWRHIIGIGLLAGIGFTVSIFVTELAFDNPGYIEISKLSIFVASTLSACFGLLALRLIKHPRKRPTGRSLTKNRT